jgi:hypothetical protein
MARLAYAPAGAPGAVELVVTVGYYGMVCRVLETLGIDLEQEPK